LPGLDVMHSETFQGEVSIRGLNKSLNNRMLVLLDGKPVLNGYYDKVAWESIPIGVEEIDRIEVVEGPVSALYGANAVNGVINIISRTPGQLAGGVVRLTAGQRDTYLGNALYGMRRGNLDGKISLGRRTTNLYIRGMSILLAFCCWMVVPQSSVAQEVAAVLSVELQPYQEALAGLQEVYGGQISRFSLATGEPKIARQSALSSHCAPHAPAHPTCWRRQRNAWDVAN